MSRIKITQVKSSIGRSQKQKDTLIALGIRGISKSVERDINPQIQGMVNKIAHLVIIEEI